MALSSIIHLNLQKKKTFSKISIILCLLFLKITSGHPQNPQICTSDECHRQAESFLRNIDTSVSPCDNFYQFACGNFKPSPKLNHLEVIEKVLKRSDKESDPKYLKMAKKVYNSCLDAYKHDSNYWGRLVVDNLRSVGWPLKEYEHDDNLGNFIQYFQFPRFLYGYFFSLSSGQTSKNENIIRISKPRYEIVNQDNLNAYRRIEDFYQFIEYPGIDLHDITESMHENLKFKHKLTKILKFNTIDKSQKIVKVKELQSRIFPSINWVEFFNNFFNGEIKVTENDKVYIGQVETLQDISRLLSETPFHVVANFIGWNFLEYMYFGDDNLLIYNKELKESSFVTSEWTSNTNILKPKTDSYKCIETISNNFKMLSSAIYGREVLTEDLKIELDDMLWMIKRQLFLNFELSDWLDEKTKSGAVKKLQEMRFVLGYPEEFDDDDFFDNYYKKVNFYQDYYKIIQDMMDFNKAKFIENFKNPNEMQVLERDSYQATFVNALMDPFYNKVFLHAAFINHLDMSTSIPRSLSYGAVGTILGHEIIHGYDNTLRHYDYKGDEVNWWEKEADQSFINKSQCLIDQYSSYTEPITLLNIDGVQTLGENIADNGGFILAYNSYQKWLKINKIDQTLPNLNFTSNQLFWLSTAQFWCENRSYDDLKVQIKLDSHSPGSIRVIGTLGNLKEFSDDFQCPNKSEMNREHKCKVW